jgi:hypothetical protein
MATRWFLTFDCARPSVVAAFWAIALGYVEPPPPEGFSSWEEWLRAQDPDDWDAGAYLVDPEGVGPKLSFMRVPEGKTCKNRLHLDIQAGGGRQNSWDKRWPLVMATVEKLVAAGGSVVRQYDGEDGNPDHMLMRDPEGNEFCVL